MTEQEPPQSAGPGNQLMREASLWFARMRGPDAESLRPEFEAWLARGALHRRAYNRAAEIFTMGKLLAEEEEQPPEAGGPAWRWRKIAFAVVAVGALLALCWVAISAAVSTLVVPSSEFVRGDQLADAAPYRLTTRAGEVRTVRLADGSSVTLGSGSDIVVAFNRAERTLRLERGRARFEVFHEVRPFIVRAGAGTVTARGTVFDVTISDARQVTVRLISGAVDVALPGNAGDQDAGVRRLGPGEMISFPQAAPAAETPTSGPQPESAPGRPATPPASRDYDDVRMADIVAEANRHSQIAIRLADPEIGEQRLSGHFRTGDPVILADRLAALFDLVVDRSNPGEIVLRRR